MSAPHRVTVKRRNDRAAPRPWDAITLYRECAGDAATADEPVRPTSSLVESLNRAAADLQDECDLDDRDDQQAAVSPNQVISSLPISSDRWTIITDTPQPSEVRIVDSQNVTLADEKTVTMRIAVLQPDSPHRRAA